VDNITPAFDKLMVNDAVVRFCGAKVNSSAQINGILRKLVAEQKTEMTLVVLREQTIPTE
jgi:hypothetical protein